MQHNNQLQVIDEFFNSFSLPQATKYIHQLIIWADKEKHWQKQTPSLLLWFTAQLQKLVPMVYEIVSTNTEHENVILNLNLKEQELPPPVTYCNWHRHSPWQFIPRHLSVKEFNNPYKALKKFTRYRTQEKWNEVIEDCCYYALSNSCIGEFADGTSLYLTAIHLYKMVEACHLISVRSIWEPLPERRKYQNSLSTGGEG